MIEIVMKECVRETGSQYEGMNARVYRSVKGKPSALALLCERERRREMVPVLPKKLLPVWYTVCAVVIMSSITMESCAPLATCQHSE